MVRFPPPKSHDAFCPPISRFPKDYGEKKTDKEKSHKGIWRSDAPEASQGQTRDVPGTVFFFPQRCGSSEDLPVGTVSRASDAKSPLRLEILPASDLKIAAIRTLIFLSLLLGEKLGKPPQKSKDCFSLLNPKIPRKEGENPQEK